MFVNVVSLLGFVIFFNAQSTYIFINSFRCDLTKEKKNIFMHSGSFFLRKFSGPSRIVRTAFLSASFRILNEVLVERVQKLNCRVIFNDVTTPKKKFAQYQLTTEYFFEKDENLPTLFANAGQENAQKIFGCNFLAVKLTCLVFGLAAN